MALFTGQRGTEDTAPDPSSGAPGTDGYRRLNRRCMISIYINYGIWYAILLAICTFLATFSQNLSDPYYEIARLALLGVPAAVLVYVVVAPPVFYTRYRYRITDDRVEVRRGVLVIRHTLVPIERVHQVEITRGPIKNLLGLADVAITTAGGVATINYLELEEAERVAELLNKLIGEMLRERLQAPASSVTGSADE